MLSGMLTSEEARVLRNLLARAEVIPSPALPFMPGDIVQIQPLADQTFGGMLVEVCQASPYELRGFLLRPHRGGCRQAWLRLKPVEVERIGRTYWPDPEFARRCEWKTPACTWMR